MTIRLRTPRGKQQIFDELLDLLEETAARTEFFNGTPKELVFQEITDQLELVSMMWKTHCERSTFIQS